MFAGALVVGFFLFKRKIVIPIAATTPTEARTIAAIAPPDNPLLSFL